MSGSIEIGTYVVGHVGELAAVIFGIQPASTYNNPFDRQSSFDIRTGMQIKSIKACSAWGAGTNQLRNVYGHQSAVPAYLEQTADGSRIKGSIELFSAGGGKSYAALGMNCVVELDANEGNINIHDTNVTVLNKDHPLHSNFNNNGKNLASHTDVIVRSADYAKTLAESVEAVAGPDFDGLDDGFILHVNNIKTAMTTDDKIVVAFPYFSTARYDGRVPLSRVQMALKNIDEPTTARCTFNATTPSAADVEGHTELADLSEGTKHPSQDATGYIVGFNPKALSDPASINLLLPEIRNIGLASLSSSYLKVPVKMDLPVGSSLSIFCKPITVTSGITITLGSSDREVPAPNSANLMYVMHENAAGAPAYENPLHFTLRNHNGIAAMTVAVGVAVVASSILAMFF